MGVYTLPSVFYPADVEDVDYTADAITNANQVLTAVDSMDDEIEAARGNKASIDARISTVIDDDGVFIGSVSGNLWTAGSGSDYYRAAGNCGMRTTAPVAPLEVEDNGTSSGMIVKVTLDDENPWGIVIGNDTYSATDTDGLALATSNAGLCTLQARGTSSEMALGTNGAEQVRIDNSGHMGLGGLPNQGGSSSKTFTVEGNASRHEFVRTSGDGDDYSVGFTDYRTDGNTTNHELVARFAINTDGSTATQRGGKFVFSTKPDGSTTLTERFRIAEDGGIFISNLLAAAASTDVNINGSNELHSVTSSKRFKENIKDIKIDSSLIYKLRPVEYDFKEEFGGGHEIGLIAEEVEKILPNLVVKKTDLEKPEILDKDGNVITEAVYSKVFPYSVIYSRLPILMLNEMKKMRKELDKLKMLTL